MSLRVEGTMSNEYFYVVEVRLIKTRTADRSKAGIESVAETPFTYDESAAQAAFRDAVEAAKDALRTQ